MLLVLSLANTTSVRIRHYEIYSETCISVAEPALESNKAMRLEMIIYIGMLYVYKSTDYWLMREYIE